MPSRRANSATSRPLRSHRRTSSIHSARVAIATSSVTRSRSSRRRGARHDGLGRVLTVKKLLPGYLADRASLEAKKAELEATLTSAEPSGEDEEEGEEPEETLSEEEKRALKGELSGVKKKRKALEGGFVKELEATAGKV